jgi:hypothetical protein
MTSSSALIHELGHLLAKADAPAAQGMPCKWRIACLDCVYMTEDKWDRRREIEIRVVALSRQAVHA